MRRREFLVGASAAATWTSAARGQQAGKIPRIGQLLTNTEERERQIFGDDPFGLRDLGYIEGKNILIERRYADGHEDRQPALAAELVALKVDLILTAGAGAYAAWGVTKTLPIVAAATGGLVEQGLAASLAHPGGNVTGTTFRTEDLVGKRLELLKQVVPSLTRAGVLVLQGATTDTALQSLIPVAKAGNIELLIMEVVGKNYGQAFSAAAAAEALVVTDLGQFVGDAATICSLANARHLPAAGLPFFPALGALIGYGPFVPDLFRRAGALADKILKGERPGDIPVEIAAKFQTVINLKTAKALGIEVPTNVLAAANDVIE